MTDLNPGLGQLLLNFSFNPLVWGLALGALALYFHRFAAVRRDLARRELWPVWRAVCFALGVVIGLVALQGGVASFTLNSMALYVGRLMVLAELAPPLLLLGLPTPLLRHLTPRSGVLGRVLAFLLDPVVGFSLWTAVVVFWNLPVGFNASLINNTTETLLPFFYLFTGLLVWAHVQRPFEGIQRLSLMGRGAFGVIASAPMMIVATVWVAANQVLYMPYINAPCLWDWTPLQNQQVSGWVMMLAGFPALAIAFGMFMAGLFRFADGEGNDRPRPSGG